MEELFANILIIGMVGIIIILVYLLIVLIQYVLAKGLPKDTVIAITGGLGTGKSLIGTNLAIKKLNRYRMLWSLGYLNQKEIPLLYSNIPIKVRTSLVIRSLMKRRVITLASLGILLLSLIFMIVKQYQLYSFAVASISIFMYGIMLTSPFIILWYFIAKKGDIQKYEMSVQLTYKHLVLFERQNEYNVTFIDEVGHTASQWDFDNPFVMIYIQDYVRFYRHNYDGTLIYVDQSSSNVAKPIRVRTNKVYNLVDFRRSFIFFYKVNVVEIMMGEDIETNYSNQFDELPYYFGHLPFKWFKFLDITRLIPFVYKRYESRVYYPIYAHVPLKKPKNWDENLYTKYLIEVPQNNKLKKKYKEEGYITMDFMLEFVKEQQEIRLNEGKKKTKPTSSDEEATTSAKP